MDKISVVVPVYNSEDSLQNSLDSILKQTYKNLEVILINDGSTDGSGGICKEYATSDDRVRVIQQDNGGISKARNAGLEAATGKYLSFVDSGDWLEKDIYEYSIFLFNEHDCDVVDFECVFTSTYVKQHINNQSNRTSIVNGNKEILRDYLYKGQTRKSPFTVWRKLYKRSLFKNVKFPIGKINEDIVTNYKVLMNSKSIVYTNKLGYYYLQDSDSLSRGELKPRDFDLLDASKELIKLTENESYKDIYYLSKVKLARSYFSLLAKVARYGVSDSNINEKETVKKLTKNLRKNYIFLMKSPIPFNRKLMVSGICLNINFVKIPLALYRKLK